MAKNRTQLLLHEPNLYKAFIILALPVFGANFMKAFNELVDTYFIGQIPDSVTAQAGISIAWPLINIFTCFLAGLSVAGVAVVSQLLGAGEKEAARKNAGMLLALSVGFGVVLNLLLCVCCAPILRFMGAQGAVLQTAVSYVQIRSFELLFTFIFAAFQAIRQAQGDTVTPVILSLASVLANIILTGLFVQVFGMGAAGAAWATVLGNVLVAPVCLWLLFSRQQPLYLELSHLRIRPQLLGHIASIATPAAGSQALSSLGFLILQAVILSFGDTVAAAFSIGNKLSNLLLMPVFALGSVLAAYVGQNIGAGNPARARKAYHVSRNIAFWLAVVGSIALYPLRHIVVVLLSNDPATQTVAVEYVFWVLLTQPLMALFQNYLGVFNGAGNTRYSFILATARLWVIRLPLILFFKACTNVGRAGVWYAMVLSNLIILAVGALLFRRVSFAPLTAKKAQK